MNLWRNIPPGDSPPNIVNVIIEVISGSRDKYKYEIDLDIQPLQAEESQRFVKE